MTDDARWDEVREILRGVGDMLGRELAEYTEYGSLLGLGENSLCKTRKWALVLATNDAADHLLDWVDDQKKMRLEAAKKADLDIATFSDGTN